MPNQEKRHIFSRVLHPPRVPPRRISLAKLFVPLGQGRASNAAEVTYET
jgi:hypothetical protein